MRRILLAPTEFRLRDREPSQRHHDILQRIPRANGHDGDSERSFAPRMKRDTVFKMNKRMKGTRTFYPPRRAKHVGCAARTDRLRMLSLAGDSSIVDFVLVFLWLEFRHPESFGFQSMYLHAKT